MRPTLLVWATTALALTASPTPRDAEPEPGNIQVHGAPFDDPHVFLTGHGTAHIGIDLVTRGNREDYRVPTCQRKPHKIHSRRKWAITYDGDDLLNGGRCGKSVKKALKWHVTCRPLTDWTCVADGKPGMGGVKIGFSTPVGCHDKTVRKAVLKGTRGKVDVWCEHL